MKLLHDGSEGRREKKCLLWKKEGAAEKDLEVGGKDCIKRSITRRRMAGS